DGDGQQRPIGDTNTDDRVAVATTIRQPHDHLAWVTVRAWRARTGVVDVAGAAVANSSALAGVAAIASFCSATSLVGGAVWSGACVAAGGAAGRRGSGERARTG